MTFCQNLLISSTPAFTELITSSSVCLSVCPFACPSVATQFYFRFLCAMMTKNNEIWHALSLYRSSFC